MNYLPAMIAGMILCAVALCVLLVLEGGETDEGHNDHKSN